MREMIKRKGSKKPKKMRKNYFNRSLHRRQKKMMAPLTEEARIEYGIKRAPVRTGDQVIVEKGDFKDHIGEVVRVDRKDYQVYLEGVSIEKPSGQDVNIPVKPWDVSIMELKMDEVRRETLKRKEKSEKLEEKPEPVEEEEESQEGLK